MVNGGTWLLVGLLALGIGAVFSALSQSLRTASRARLEELALIKNVPAATARVERILSNLDGHAAAIALPRIICNLLVVVGFVMWVTVARGLPGPTWIEGAIGVLISAVMLWVFGFIVSNSVARHIAEPTIYTWSRFLRISYALAGPLRFIPDVTDEVVRRLSGRAERTTEDQIQEDLLSVVAEAEEDGTVDEAERDMIEAIVRFRERTVAQVMTPRTEIMAMELSNNLGAVTEVIRKIGFSRIPVYEGDLDHVVGIFYVKDLMKWLAGDGTPRSGKGFDLRSLLRKAHFVPESKSLRELLPELLSKRIHIAMVADEYGGTAGLVTIEDIVEEVFGDIHDEYELASEVRSDVKLDEGSKSAEVEARAYIGDVNQELEPLGVELPESEDYDTVAGFVTAQLGHIPSAGESFRHDGLIVTVLAAEPTRVTRVRVEKAPMAAAETGTPVFDE